MPTGTSIPPRPATRGNANRRRSRSSPRSNSRRASRPTTKKKHVISPLFTQWRRSSSTPAPPRSIESIVPQSDLYDDASTFTHMSAATAAASKNAAPPVSVRRNSRRGVSMLRAQAVRPENADGLPFGALILGRASSSRDRSVPDALGRSLDRCHVKSFWTPLAHGNAERLRRLPDRRLSHPDLGSRAPRGLEGTVAAPVA